MMVKANAWACAVERGSKARKDVVKRWCIQDGWPGTAATRTSIRRLVFGSDGLWLVAAND